MKVTQEKLPASQVGLKIEVPGEMSKASYERVIQKYTREARIPGFRSGKIPRQVILQRFGNKNIKAEALENIINDCIDKTIRSENIPALGNFQIKSDFDTLVQNYEPGHLFTFEATLDVAPEVKLGNYQGLSIKAEEHKYDEAELEAVIERKRSEMASKVPVEGRSAQISDVAVVDFSAKYANAEGEATGEEIEGTKAEDFEIELSQSGFAPGFNEGIVGMNIGETKTIAVKFAEDYPEPDLAGENTVFTVTLKDLKAKELPELDDEFAQRIAGGNKTWSEVREDWGNRIKEDKEYRTKINIEEAIETALMGIIETELPESMIEQEVVFLLNQQASMLQRQGLDVAQLFTREMIPSLKEAARPQAIERIKKALAIREVANQQNIKPTEAEIKEEMTNALASMKNAKDVDREELRDLVEAELVKQKTLDWLKTQCQIELLPLGTLRPIEEYNQDDEDYEDYEDDEDDEDDEIDEIELDLEVAAQS